MHVPNYMLLLINRWGQACISLLNHKSTINSAICSTSPSDSGRQYSLTGSAGGYPFPDHGNGTVMTITTPSTFCGVMITLPSFMALCD